jgi:CRP-like cAMP-binding protein
MESLTMTIDVPRRIPESIQGFLERVGKERSIKTGEILFRTGEGAGTMHWVRSGAMGLYRDLDEERREIVGWIQPGEILGELEFLDGGQVSLTAVALEDTQLLEIGRDVLDPIEQDHPGLAFDLYSWMARLLSERLRLDNDLLKREILRGIESSGSQLLDLHYIIRDTFQVKVSLTGGETFEGKIMLMSRSQAGYYITILDNNGDFVYIPYDSVACIKAYI